MLGFSIIIIADFYRIRRQTKSFWGGHILKNSQEGFELRLEQYFSDGLVMVSGQISPNIETPGGLKNSQPKEGKVTSSNFIKKFKF